MANDGKATDNTIDPALIAALVRKVVARLQENGPINSDARVVTLDTIEKHQTRQLIVTTSAVITPAARDEARRRGIEILRTNEPSNLNTTANKPINEIITDPDNPQRANTVAAQIKRRAVQLGSARIVLSDSPAAEVHKQISNGNRATMITAIADVQRFADELDPTVWVLDMKRLNIPAAVNTVVKIAQQGARKR